MKRNNISKSAKSLQFLVAFIIILLFFGSWGCNKNEDADFNSDFSIEYKDNNHVLFTNTSSGEFYSLTWDFGNGEKETTTDKKKIYEIYYPSAGDYEISLKVTNYTGGNKTTKKTITIAASDLIVSFSAEPDPTDPNTIILKNTSQGNYDSFKWIYRNKEIENELEVSAYFPFAGNYEIELQVVKNSNIFSEKKSVNIAQEDPDYIDNLTLAWSDEFDGTTVNTDFWTFETGASGWGNAELQNYTNGDNAEVVDGKLIITARKVNDNTEPGSYTSSRIKTQGKKEFQYGRMEIRAKLPSGTGMWPAIWMLGSNFNTAGWPASGEIDIMEYVGYQPNTVFSTVHTPSGYGGTGSGSSMNVPTCEEEFHNYGLIWTEKKLVFYVDETDNVMHTYSPATKTIENWPFDQPGFFILNVAVGGTWGGAQGVDNSIFPQSMEIDYVRVYQEAK